MHITYQIDIAAPIDSVFALLDDDDQLMRWMDGLEGTTYPNGKDPANPVGVRFRQRIREGGRVTEYDGAVTAYAKPTHLGVRIGNRSFTMEVDYHLTAGDGATRLDYAAQMVEASRFARVMARLFGWLTRRILRKQMTKLKACAEADAATT